MDGVRPVSGRVIRSTDDKPVHVFAQPKVQEVGLGPVSGVPQGASFGRRLSFPTRFNRSIRIALLGTTMLMGFGAPLPAIAQQSKHEDAEIRVVDGYSTPQGVLRSQILSGEPELLGVMMGNAQLVRGDKSPAVQRVQEALQFLGFAVGKPDGDFGGNTERALNAFAIAYDYPPRSLVDEMLHKAIDRAVVKAESIQTQRFRSPDFLSIASGQEVVGEGHSNTKLNEVLQASLYSLGYDLGPYFIDGDFGGATTKAVEAFQIDHHLEVTGTVGTSTLTALDRQAKAQLDSLQAAVIPDDGSRAEQYEIVADLVSNRIYVVNAETQVPLQRYLTSPGKAGKETRGNDFEVTRRLVRRTWYPTPSMQARGLTSKGPGLDNPMGLVKFDLGGYYQYIHGTPFSVRNALGRPASSGCLRMSSENILHLEQFVEVGTKVSINRDPAVSAALVTAAADAGVEDTELTAGRESLAAYLTGELGEDHVP